MVLTKKFCPRCGSEDVHMIAGGITGSWMCGNCGYTGSIFPEKEIVGSKEKFKTEIIKKINVKKPMNRK
ncbi:hypothetical protein CXX78_01660 [Candidatus Parvarchaeota archaeon]|jgi:ribosomal protein S27AE|nr:MAG: hypothetical protein CXX78_01660 [Candidatus Parvarchaeota archaeon]